MKSADRTASDGDKRKRKKDRKSTRLNSSHLVISYAVFCLKKKKKAINTLFDYIKCEPEADISESLGEVRVVHSRVHMNVRPIEAVAHALKAEPQHGVHGRV